MASGLDHPLLPRQMSFCAEVREGLSLMSRRSAREGNSSSRGSSLGKLSRISSAVSKRVFGRKTKGRTSDDSRQSSAELGFPRDTEIGI